MKEFVVCISHDIDSLSYRKRYRLRGLLASKKFAPLNPKFNPCAALDETIAAEQAVGAKSTFFFLDYDERALATAADAGCEIALHADAKTIQDYEALKEAKRKLEEFAGKRVYGLRQHYYDTNKMDFGSAWKNAERAGFEYDSSLGKRWKHGKHGNASGFFDKQPFRPVRGLVELPVNVVDAALMYDLRFSPTAAFQKTKKAIDAIASRRGVFVFLTHLNNVFDDYNLPGWRDYYSAVLLYCQDKGARFLTCRKAAAGFR